MIPPEVMANINVEGKPRASGDDPGFTARHTGMLS